MKRLKNLWCLMLAVCMALAVTACASGSPAASEPTPSASVTANPSEAASESPRASTPAATSNPSSQPVYKDGTYELTTDKDREGYYVKASLTVKDGKISDFHYDIYDSNNKDMLFDEKYEELFPQEEYKQQCRDDLAGMKTYGPKLVETQSVDEVDVVSKATWTWDWFKKVAKELLDQATVK